MNLFLSVFPSLFLFAAFPAGKDGKKTRVRVRQRAADCIPRWLGKSFLCDASPAMSSSFPDAGGLGCFVLFCVGEAAIRAGTYGPGMAVCISFSLHAAFRQGRLSWQPSL